MQLLSQQDPRWKNKKVGTGSLTFGQVGCTITCIAMKFYTTPDVVNENLKAVGGYLSDNLVIWKKLEEALPGVKFTYRHNLYDNNVAKANLPCLVEVSGAKIGGDRHWVLFIGNQRMYDPWDGTEKPTNFYGMPLGLVVLQGSFQQKKDETIYRDFDLTNKESMKVMVDLWYRIHKGEFVEKGVYEEMKKTRDGAVKQLADVLKANGELLKLLDQKEQQDSTIIDHGIKAEIENGKLKQDIEQVAKAAGVEKPIASVIVNRINVFRMGSEKWFRQKLYQQDQKKNGKPSVKKNTVSIMLEKLVNDLSLTSSGGVSTK